MQYVSTLIPLAKIPIQSSTAQTRRPKHVPLARAADRAAFVPAAPVQPLFGKETAEELERFRSSVAGQHLLKIIQI